MYRGGSTEERGRVGALSGWHQSLSDRDRRLSHVLHVAVPGRRVRVLAPGPPQHLTQLQLHGSAGRLRPDPQLRAPALQLFIGRGAAVEAV